MIRITLAILALLIGSYAAFCIWIATELRYVFVRPVYDAVESGEGNPYEIARNCMDAYASEFTGPAITLLACLAALFVLAVTKRRPASSVNFPDPKNGE
ncbi:hypothetical protein [Allorhodopirellula solitaria]|uniref:Uncharacterized protein n=1 Tax=Allorhodopirellula solitaria TaxID=2527987 RepID=A0A5C5X178_9BACT|nr:hypothetical protein [Allorhodopirellula solitaria]TWT56083.1 hypothetical protein CA85_45560 [Allorhodopirellula solitaria]TWT56618.1 hypothetical protein CA85_41520 [Allorhodopirellula solitaria]